MIGRTEQLEQIMGIVRSVGSGTSGANVLFVTGEAGIGKSTLLRAVKHECGLMPHPPLIGLAECSTPLAGQDIGEVESLQPWGEIMAELITAKPEKRHETSKLVGDLALAWVKVIPVIGDVIDSIADSTKILKSHMASKDDASNAASQQQIFQQYINFLGKLADNGPLLLIIDDVHWADTASTNLLFAAARQLLGRPVLFIMAYRPDDAASSRGGEGHPLIHIRNELERYDLAVDIGVPQLTRAEASAMLRSRYPKYESNERFEEWLVRTGGGNALFISQFLITLAEDGFVDPETGAAHEGYESIRVPSSAQAVVKERIRRLSEDARELLRYASVEGDTFTSSVLSKITELPQLKLLQRLRLLEESHKIIKALGKQRIYTRETSAFQFGHVLLHKAMYDDLGEEERELLHEAVLEVLKEEWELAQEEGTNIEGIAARLAVHARVLGKHAFAADVLIAGANATWTEYAAEETMRMLDDALQSLAQVATVASKREKVMRVTGEAYLLRARVLLTCARFSESLAAVHAAQVAFESVGDTNCVIDALNAEARTLRQKGDNEVAEPIARKALELAENSDYLAGAAEALTTIGHLQSNAAEFEKALESYVRSLDIARERNDRRNVAVALDNIGSINDSLGRYIDARGYLEESLAVLREIGDRVGEASVLLNLGVLDMRRGSFDTAREMLQTALDRFRASGDVLNENAVVVNLGVIAIHLQDYEEALRYSGDALGIARRIGDRRSEAAALGNIGEIALATDDMASAQEYFSDGLTIQEEMNDREGIIIARINLADVYSRTTRAEEAREQATIARDLAASIGSRFLEVMAIGHLGYTDAMAMDEASNDDEKSQLRERAIERLTEAVTTLDELGSHYADTWRVALASVQSGTSVRTLASENPNPS